MTGLFGQSEKANTVLFSLFLMLLILSLLFIDGVIRPYAEPFFLGLLFFGSIVYGFVSKNPKKSFLLGVLIWASLPIAVIISESVKNQYSIFDWFILSEVTILFLILFIIGIISGSSGYLIATENQNFKIKILYWGLALILWLFTFFLYFELS